MGDLLLGGIPFCEHVSLRHLRSVGVSCTGWSFDVCVMQGGALVNARVLVLDERESGIFSWVVGERSLGGNIGCWSEVIKRHHSQQSMIDANSDPADLHDPGDIHMGHVA